MKNLETLINELCPDGVEFQTMEEIFEIRNGYTPSKNNPDFWENGTIPWFRMEDIRQNGRILSDAIQHITPAAIKGKGLFPVNSIIIATTATIGEHALVIADSLANQRFTNLTVRKSLTDRLASRFVSGLLADIQTPEYDTRCAIVKRKAELLNFEIDDNVIQYIAGQIKSNIRQLEGITKKLHAMCVFGEQKPTIALAQTAIKDILTDVQPLHVTVDRIVDEVSRTTGVSVDDIMSKKHTANVSDARKMCFYIIREVTDMSYKNIGSKFNRDHSTVMYNIEKMEERIKTDSTLNSQVSDIISNIKDYR